MSVKPLGVIALLLIGLATGVAASDLIEPTQSTPAENEPLRNVETVKYENGTAYTNLYDEVIGSVVSIRVAGNGASAGSQGSGFVYDFEGHIVTNEHVVGTADEVEVRFSRGDWRRGEVIGTDVYTDLAVVEVDNVPEYADPLPLADGQPHQGTPVAALGNPLGLEGSISQGIVSGLNRSMRTEGNFTIPDTVQTDAGIDRGNSGGPLVTLDGEVVGVNRARQGASIGFAVSSRLMKRVIPSLITTGSVDHAYMGVATIDVSPRVADANGLDEPRGVLVAEVLDDGPSDGVLQGSQGGDDEIPTGGDVIVGIEGTSIDSHEELSRYLMIRTKPGEEIEVGILRDGERETVSLTLGTRPEP